VDFGRIFRSVVVIFCSAAAVAATSSGPHWDFNSDAAGALPQGWSARGGSPKGIYRIESEPNGNRYLAARSQGSDVQLGTEVTVNPQELPVLAWRWRVWEWPKNADERKLGTMDSAASVYVVFGSRLFPKVLKYVWSDTVPVGSVFRHPRSDRMAIVVVHSGERPAGQWQTVTRNILEDSRKIFGADAGAVIGIGVKTDSDSTRTSARTDYDDLRFGTR